MGILGTVKCSEFMRALPEQVRGQADSALRKIRSAHRPWLSQLYFADATVHYELWSMGVQRGPAGVAMLELGLHFESRDRAVNAMLLAAFDWRMIEVKRALGSQWEAEPWDRGWAKVYETFPREALEEEYLERIAVRLAAAIRLLQPIVDETLSGKKSPARSPRVALR